MWADLVLALCALPVLVASSYLAALAAVGRRKSPPVAPPPGLRFDVVVPAHDEENGIGDTVSSLLSIDYPRSLFRVLVVADNCRDRTAEIAGAAGAEVLVRQQTEQRGKGFALAYAFDRSLTDRFADAVVVVDADTLVSPNLLSAFSARFHAGAAAVQASYGVRNPLASPRTRVMTIALAAFHDVRSVARERLGLSCGLRGNGMGFSREVLRQHPSQAFSIVEDVEYGIQLGYAGVRVEYVPEAIVRGHMASTEPTARSQRRRWERGRQALVRQHLPGLLLQAWRRRDPRLLDLAIDLMVPPLGQLVTIIIIGLALSLLAMRFGATIAVWPWSAAFFGILAHVFRAWVVSGTGRPGLLALLWSPAYIVWKLRLRFHDKGLTPDEWVRTTRGAQL